MTLLSLLAATYVTGMAAGFCDLVTFILDKDLTGLVRDATGFNPSNCSNGSMLILALILVPLWPLLLLRPIFNWLKRPCQ